MPESPDDDFLAGKFAKMYLDCDSRSAIVIRHEGGASSEQNTFFLSDEHCIFRRQKWSPAGEGDVEVIVNSSLFFELQRWLRLDDLAVCKNYFHPDVLDGDSYFVVIQGNDRETLERVFVNPGLSLDPKLRQLAKVFEKISNKTPFRLRLLGFWLCLQRAS